MSDTNEIKSKPKKKAFNFLIIYMIFAIVITSIATVFYKMTGTSIIRYVKEKLNLQDEKADIEPEIKEERTKVEPSNLKDKYAKNNIELKEFSEEINKEFFYETEADKEYQNKLTYYQISGLKDKIVEDKINQDIKQRVRSLVDKDEINDTNVDYIVIGSYVSANFSNVLSIYVYKIIYYIENEAVEYNYNETYLGLNYRLDTGERLKFNDLFNEKASIKKMIAQELYENLALEYGNDYAMRTEDYWSPDMDNVDYSKIELDLFRTINAYNQNNDVEFYFSSTAITPIFGKNHVGINMYENNEYIAIFNLVKPQTSLYEGGNLEEKDYVFLTPYISNTLIFQKVTSDVFLSIFSPYDETTGGEAYEEYKKVVDENINYIVALIKQNEAREENKNGKGKIYNINYIYEWEGITSASGQKIEVNLKNFEEEIENTYWEACSAEPMGDYMLMLPYSEENYYEIQFKEVEDSILKLYQRKGLDLNWTGSDGSIMDMYGNII